MKNLKPMEAVAVLYATGQEDVSRAIVASLSEAIFGGTGLEPANRAKQLLARISYRLLKWTTRSVLPDGDGQEGATVYRNVILDRSGHPYAAALMGTTDKSTQCLVEGGDPMNSQYMMISPEIRQNAGTWDRIFLTPSRGRMSVCVWFGRRWQLTNPPEPCWMRARVCGSRPWPLALG